MANDRFESVPVHEINGPGNGGLAPQDIGELLMGGNTIQQIKTSYATAVSVQRKRSLKEVEDRCLAEAEFAGDGFWYEWDVNDKRTGRKQHIEGSTIDLAMTVARNWGNCATECWLIEDKPGYYLFNAVFVDLETGSNITRPFKQNRNRKLSEKMLEGGSFEASRQDDVTFQIGASKATRNVILNATPKWLQQKMLDAARKAFAQQLTGKALIEKREETAQFFEDKYSVTRERLERYVEKPVAEWVAADIVRLRGVVQALREGRETVEAIFPPIQKEEPKAASATPPSPKDNGKTTAPTVNSSLSDEQGEMVNRISEILNTLAGDNAAEHKRLLTNWSDAKVAALTSLPQHPDLIAVILDRAEITLREAEEAKATSNQAQKKGKLL